MKLPWFLNLWLLGWGITTCCLGDPAAEAARPNVLFIAVDDLNDWIGCLGGHPQSLTPNIDRLAASGQLFSNAHCPAPACNPSRGAILSGISPHVSGLYDNRQKMRQMMPDAELLPKYFSRHGYWSAGSGKILHYFTDADSWDDYFPPKETENPFPRTFYPKNRPVSLPVGGPWQYIETDWAALDVTDEEFGGDWSVSQWIGQQLSRQHDQPFFLACGIYRPHEPWFVPEKYFQPFPLDDIQLPPGYREDDLDDLPPAGKSRGPNRYFAHIREHGQWKQAIQGYLASIHFADAMVGRVLDALANGPNRDNTIVVLWSDHGWHLGEKQHWQKYTGWRVCTRVPLIVRVPAGVSALPDGTRDGAVCSRPVNLLSLYPTLTDLAGLPAKEGNDGPSLVPLLKDPQSDWPHASLTFLNRPGNLAISGERWRYIRYGNGDHELYDTATDPHEWDNLAEQPNRDTEIRRLKRFVPETFADYRSDNTASLPRLSWHPIGDGALPESKPDAAAVDVTIGNRTGQPVDIQWIDADGRARSFGTLEAGWQKAFDTHPGTVLRVQTADGETIGYFIVDDQPCLALIPAS
ncbi:Choline-sulfatase [Crateriforma conspicua]|uniref:Choline-sulfatase n=1 Tax=Crateriforma conspicua TaxID=2527996 RepID=A0A5C6FIF7_9PLAN|nr:sulfatase-like hydrolase/transferase [Crateriforma conspicua]TWU61890.1 Choline-sulfatase [Crateriforma conspicua]